MFQDLDATLEAVLNDANAPANLRDADVSFEAPDKDFKPTQAMVNLFLYEIAENRDLRGSGRITEAVGDQFVTRYPPLRITCTYLVTAWSVKTGPQKAAEEHGLLGSALLWLGRFPELADQHLRGSLQNPVYQLPVGVAQVREDQSMGQFWSALGIAPRPAFSLTVTITMQPVEPDQPEPGVKSRVVRSVPINAQP